ncbi:hypothetical protein, conserved [Plasmodium gonderi]|uniref:Uncharacterized protein n=1 Tax=Plasmodium gonderi TaxID=77519 RepID=A0A1Y1JCY3_PLAGO|nr:hypothetical protein, conserved [Plasmodium gonderi]GAW79215.1 hypothetical protein, conserved [Plasmodium gonderi]
MFAQEEGKKRFTNFIRNSSMCCDFPPGDSLGANYMNNLKNKLFNFGNIDLNELTEGGRTEGRNNTEKALSAPRIDGNRNTNGSDSGCVNMSRHNSMEVTGVSSGELSGKVNIESKVEQNGNKVTEKVDNISYVNAESYYKKEKLNHGNSNPPLKEKRERSPSDYLNMKKSKLINNLNFFMRVCCNKNSYIKFINHYFNIIYSNNISILFKYEGILQKFDEKNEMNLTEHDYYNGYMKLNQVPIVIYANSRSSGKENIEDISNNLLNEMKIDIETNQECLRNNTNLEYSVLNFINIYDNLTVKFFNHIFTKISNSEMNIHNANIDSIIHNFLYKKHLLKENVFNLLLNISKAYEIKHASVLVDIKNDEHVKEKNEKIIFEMLKDKVEGRRMHSKQRDNTSSANISVYGKGRNIVNSVEKSMQNGVEKSMQNSVEKSMQNSAEKSMQNSVENSVDNRGDNRDHHKTLKSTECNMHDRALHGSYENRSGYNYEHVQEEYGKKGMENDDHDNIDKWSKSEMNMSTRDEINELSSKGKEIEESADMFCEIKDANINNSNFNNMISNNTDVTTTTIGSGMSTSTGITIENTPNFQADLTIEDRKTNVKKEMTSMSLISSIGEKGAQCDGENSRGICVDCVGCGSHSNCSYMFRMQNGENCLLEDIKEMLNKEIDSYDNYYSKNMEDEEEEEKEKNMNLIENIYTFLKNNVFIPSNNIYTDFIENGNDIFLSKVKKNDKATYFKLIERFDRMYNLINEFKSNHTINEVNEENVSQDMSEQFPKLRKRRCSNDEYELRSSSHTRRSLRNCNSKKNQPIKRSKRIIKKAQMSKIKKMK